MAVIISRPGTDDLSEVLDALREWQNDAAPVQLHPGDVGWFWRFGTQRATEALRAWSRDGRVLAVGLLDGAKILRLTTAPDVRRDEELARQLVTDLTRPEHGVLPEGAVNVEAPSDALVYDLLADEGWGTDAPFTPLLRDLTDPVEDVGVRVEVVGADRVSERTAVQRASFDGSTFTAERWHAMAAGPLYADARCLLGYDDAGEALGAITVWSAGPGKPGLIEPLGVYLRHRGRGYGIALTVAGAAALRELGSSSALVVTSRPAAVTTYMSAGFERHPERLDRRRAG